MNFIKRISMSISHFAKGSKSSFLKLKLIFEQETENSIDVVEAYSRFISGKGSKPEIKDANLKLRDLLKAVGLGGFCILPGTVVTLPILIMAAKKVGIDLLPESVYKQYPNLKSNKNLKKVPIEDLEK
jgi:hypothetical protein